MLHNRPIVDLSRTDIIVNQTEKDRTHSPDNTEVHSLDSHLPASWPEGKEHRNCHINQSPGIDQNTPDTGKVERTPNELRAGGVDNVRVVPSGMANPTGAATPKK